VAPGVTTSLIFLYVVLAIFVGDLGTVSLSFQTTDLFDIILKKFSLYLSEDTPYPCYKEQEVLGRANQVISLI
jgi:hypothetical protein